MTPTTPGVLNKALQVTLEGRGDITLSPTHHVATGGEGSIYKPSAGTIIKLYTDQNKMVHDDMPHKIKLLSRIKHPFIVSPRGLVFRNQKPIGYYMGVAEGEPLARVFTTTFRQREKFTDKDSIILFDGMRTVVQEAHNNKAVLVDANEFNWLLYRSKGVVEPRIIDVDSWAIDKWKPSVIMPSIRDWHTNGFNEASDWFSFAVVSFQIFTGIHPYKGMLPGYTPNDMEKRMKDNKSVFTQGVRLNSAVRDFHSIPIPLLTWYEAVFQKGERSIPPSAKERNIKVTGSPIGKKVSTIGDSDTLIFDLLFNNGADHPVQVYPCGIVRLASGTLVNISTAMVLPRKVIGPCEVVSTDYGVLVAELSIGDNTKFSLIRRDGSVIDISSQLRAKGLFRSGNRLFAITDVGLVEVTIKDFGKPLLVTVNTWQILPNSITFFDGVGIQNSLGAMYLVLPFGEASCTYVQVPDLTGVKVVNALAGSRYVVIVVLDPKSGQYYKQTYCFDQDYKTYHLEKELIDSPDLNMAILPKGVCASIVDDGELLITVPMNGQRRKVDDKQVKTSFVLGTWENKIVFLHDSKVWGVRMKNP